MQPPRPGAAPMVAPCSRRSGCHHRPELAIAVVAGPMPEVQVRRLKQKAPRSAGSEAASMPAEQVCGLCTGGLEDTPSQTV